MTLCFMITAITFKEYMIPVDNGLQTEVY